MNPEVQMALNVLLHESNVEGIDVDTNAREAVCTLEFTAEPSFGGAPANPCVLLLKGVTCVRAAVVNPDGTTPPRGITPIPLGSLNGLIRQFKHPQHGFDFIDSNRDDITQGRPIVEWVASGAAARHTLTFIYGVRGPEGRAAVVLVRLCFDEFDLRAADGLSVDLGAYAGAGRLDRAGAPVIYVPGTDAGKSAMPRPIPAQLADGSFIGVLFVDSKTRITMSYAVGKGIWTGKELKWLSPRRTLYDLPAGQQLDIRPSPAEWKQPGDPTGGFDFWTTVDIAKDDPINPRELVHRYLKPSSATPQDDS